MQLFKQSCNCVKNRLDLIQSSINSVKFRQYFNSFFTTQKQRNDFFLRKRSILRELDILFFVLECKLISLPNCLLRERKEKCVFTAIITKL